MSFTVNTEMRAHAFNPLEPEFLFITGCFTKYRLGEKLGSQSASHSKRTTLSADSVRLMHGRLLAPMLRRQQTAAEVVQRLSRKRSFVTATL
jgi:hypothetical protein